MLGALLSVLISVATAAVVGAKLLGVAKRTRQLPELSVGVGLVAFALAQLGGILTLGVGEHLSPAASEALRGFALFNFTLASLGLSLFTVETFGRTPSRWALASSLVVAGATLRGAMLYDDIPIITAGTSHSAIPSLAAVTFALGFLWLGIEGLQYYRKVRRAYTIGLASAEIVNRFLVLGVGGVSSGLFAAGAAAAGVAEGPLADLRSFFVCAGGLATTVMCVLVFVPPAAYRKFVEARAARSVPSHG